MTTPDRSVEEIVEELIDKCTDPETGELHIGKYDHEFLEKLLTQTLQAERQKRDEMVEKIVEELRKEIPTYLNKRGHHTNSAHRKIKYNQALDDVKKALKALTQANNPK